MVYKISSLFFQRIIWLPLRVFTLLFCSAKIEGLENLTNLKTNVILAANHASELDGPLIAAALPFFSKHMPLAFVAREKSFYKNNPRGFLYGGVFFALMGARPAYAGKKSYEQSLPNHLAALRRGESVCIFPLGRKHTLEEGDKARGGVSYLAHKTGLPIVPVLIEEESNLSLLDYIKGKGALRITFGSPLYAGDIFPATATAADRETHASCELAAVTVMSHIVKLSTYEEKPVLISSAESASGTS